GAGDLAAGDLLVGRRPIAEPSLEHMALVAPEIEENHALVVMNWSSSEIDGSNLPVAQEPSPWILRYLPLVAAGGRALDVAAGAGRHSRAMLAQGLEVTAVDRDPDQQPDAPGLTKVQAD